MLVVDVEPLRLPLRITCMHLAERRHNLAGGEPPVLLFQKQDLTAAELLQVQYLEPRIRAILVMLYHLSRWRLHSVHRVNHGERW